MEERKELLKTYGFDLLKVVEEARANGNEAFAAEVERNIANLQSCFDVIAQKNTSTGGEDLWKIDVEYLKTKLI